MLTRPIRICVECLATSVDGHIDDKCFDGDHQWVKAKVSDCRYLERTPAGRVNRPRLNAAWKRCGPHDSHHPATGQHIQVPRSALEEP